jgi:hypothetical protein
MAETYWFVGASYDRTHDQTPRFLAEGIWENGYDDRYLDQVKSMRPGQRIAIKSSYTQKHNLPFDAQGQAVSVMAIKAIGTITENRQDGKRVKVDWKKVDPPRIWCFYTNRLTVWRVEATDWCTEGLIDFTFKGQPQDIDRFRNAPYWKDRYGDHSKSNPFAWTEFYEAFARKLLEYRHNRAPLIDGLRALAEIQPLLTYITNDENPAKNRIALDDICPFTLMGGFNRGKVTNRNRTTIAGQLAQMIGIDNDPPTVFDGIPILNPQNSWFFSYAYHRKPDDIEKLWCVFEAAIKLADDENGTTRNTFIEAYNAAIQIRGTSWNLSQGFYWVLPWHYLTLDGLSRDYLERQLGIPILKSGQGAPCSGDRYLELVDQLEGEFTSNRFPVHNFPSLSLAAWKFGSDADESPIQQATVTQTRADQGGRMSKNVIYYGPPGTGKTKAVLDLLKANYTDAPQQIDSPERQRQAIAERMATARWWEAAAAALHDLGGKATVPEIARHPFIQAIAAAKNRTQGIKQTLWRTLQTYTVEESATVRLKKRLSPSIFDKGDDSVWRFAGEWQEACADLIEWVDALKKGGSNSAERKRYRFVTFHQSYGYEEFIEGLRPVLATDSEAEADSVAYEMRAGVFKELCREARLSPGQRFALVIDEINRGNISKIFGELITLIEADKRDPLDGTSPPADVTLAFSGEKFSVPANVDVIGTMNTADRSLALLDTALRRRFDFVALMPDTRAEQDPVDPSSAPLAGLVVTLESGIIDIRRMLERINARIEALYDRDHCIGHAYFTHLLGKADGLERFAALTDTFRNRIMPLLEEYFFEDRQKIRLVLADNQKQDPQAQFIIEAEDHEQDLATLFGNDHGLDAYTTKRRCALQDEAFSNPLAYIGVYQSPGD